MLEEQHFQAPIPRTVGWSMLSSKGRTSKERFIVKSSPPSLQTQV